MQRTKRITVRLEPLIVSTLATRAEARELSVSSYVRALLIRMLEQDGELDPRNLYQVMTDATALAVV
jgi:hypothetical protein